MHRADSSVGLVPHLAASKASYLSDAAAADLATLMYGDACSVMAANALIPDVAACRAFRTGVLTKGINSALINFLALSRGIIARRQAATVTSLTGWGTVAIANVTSPYYAPGEINGPELADALVFSNTYLMPAFGYISILFAEQSQATITWVRNFLVGLLVSFMLLFAAYQFTVFLPQVARTNTEIKSERIVMLLLPARLLQAVPELTSMMERMLAAEDKAAAAAAAAGGGVS